MTGPIPGKLTVADLDPGKIYFAWYALDELVDTFSSKMLACRIVPSTFSEANVRNLGVVVSPMDREVGERGAQYAVSYLRDGTPLESLPTHGPPFHIWINCTAVENKGIPLSPQLSASDVILVPDAGEKMARADCLSKK